MGTNGQLEIDLQDARPRKPIHAAHHLTRAGRLLRTFAELHPAQILRAPGYEPSFAQALRVFFGACRTRTQPDPDPLAGLAVLRAVGAARVSIAQGGAPAAITAAAIEPERHPT